MREPGLLLILTEPAGPRAAAALELAATAAALGRPVALLLKAGPLRALDDPALAAALVSLLELGASLTACQTALDEVGLHAADLPAGITTGGLVALMAAHPGAQLLIG